MNEMICIGKIVGTHGIKGELRILSNFEKKLAVFTPNFKIYFGSNYEEFKITNYRHHKNYEMITLEGISNINEVLKYKGMFVYIKRSDLRLTKNEYLLDELIGMVILHDKKELGKVGNIVYNNANILMEIKGARNFYIPINDNFIVDVNLDKKEIIVKNIEGLII